jgi:hypothetical protein
MKKLNQIVEARAIKYFSDWKGEAVELHHPHGMDNAKFAAAFPDVKGKKSDSFQKFVGYRPGTKEHLPVTRTIEFKTNNPSLHVCDARCMNAKGRNCECSCRGKNHGAGMNHLISKNESVKMPKWPKSEKISKWIKHELGDEDDLYTPKWWLTRPNKTISFFKKLRNVIEYVELEHPRNPEGSEHGGEWTKQVVHPFRSKLRAVAPKPEQKPVAVPVVDTNNWYTVKEQNNWYVYDENHYKVGNIENENIKTKEEAIEYFAYNKRVRLKNLSDKATRTAKELNFNTSKISITLENKMFSLNGKEYPYAGEANLTEGKIILYEKNITYGVEELLAHEIEHIKYQTFLINLDNEIKVMQKELQLMPTGANDPMLPDGTLRNGWEKKFPLYQAHTKLMNKNSIKDFAETDGTTNYSEEWWKAHHNGEATSSQAFHETLAEIAATDYFHINFDIAAPEFKKAGISLDMRTSSKETTYSLHKWGQPSKESQIDPETIHPKLKNIFHKLQRVADRPFSLYNAREYKKPAPCWQKLYDMVNDNWDKQL